MITLYHCDGARSFRPLWMLEELGLPYELKMLPFPPRVFAKEYLALNPLGTIPFMIDGETKMTEVLRHLSLSRHQIWPDAAGRRRRRAGLWRVPELDVFQRRHADLSANAGAALQPARAGGAAQSAGRRPITPNGSWAGCGRSRPPPPRPRRCAPAGSPRPISSSAMRCGWPEISGWPRISGPTSAPIGQRLQARDGYKRAVAAERKRRRRAESGAAGPCLTGCRHSGAR